MNEPLATSLAHCVEIDELLNANGKRKEKSLALGTSLSYSPFKMPTIVSMVIWQSTSRSIVFSRLVKNDGVEIRDVKKII